jgi:monoamine oxidase
VLEGTGMAPMFQPVGGMDQFPKGFQRKLGDTITHGAEIVSIRQGTSDVKVAYRNVKTGAMTEVTADYCVSCLPLTILRGLDVNLSPETMAAVKATPYSPSAKMGLQMKRRFWEEDDKIFGGHLYSNLPLGTLSYPSWGYWGDKGVLLGFYGSGQTAGLINKPIKERIEHVLTHASKVHPQIRAEYETAYCTWWEKTPYSLGAFAGGGGGGSTSDRLAVLGKPDNRIFIGCAAVSGNGGWQEGAVAAAWKQVKQLHERAMGGTA